MMQQATPAPDSPRPLLPIHYGKAALRITLVIGAVSAVFLLLAMVLDPIFVLAIAVGSTLGTTLGMVFPSSLQSDAASRAGKKFSNWLSGR